MHVHIEFNSRLFGAGFKSVNFKTPQFKFTTIRYSLCIVEIVFLLKLQICFQNTVMSPQFSAKQRMSRQA